jgi:spermidine synthase
MSAKPKFLPEKRLNKFLSFLSGEKVIEKTRSQLNGEIIISEFFGQKRIICQGLLQSGSIIHGIWNKALKKVKNTNLPVGKILILGLGGGTAAQIASEFWPTAQITGVEIDPVIIRLAKKHFQIDQIPNLKIIQANAITYLINHQSSIINHQFNLILVDMYLGDCLPPKSEGPQFLNALKKNLSQNGIVIFNRLFWREHKGKARKFTQKIEKIFSQIELIRTPSNLLILAS